MSRLSFPPHEAEVAAAAVNASVDASVTGVYQPPPSAAERSPVVGTPPLGPRRLGKLGNALRQLRFVLDPIGTVTRRFARYGDAYRVPQEGGDLYVFRHPDQIRDVLVSQAGSFDKQHGAFRRLSLVLGDALLTSDGERWRRQRRLVQPAFARSRLAEYSAVMVDEAAQAVKRLTSSPGEVDLSRELNALTLRVVTRTLFGHPAEDTTRTGSAMLELNRWFGTPSPLLRFMPGARRRFETAQHGLHQEIENLIAGRRHTLTPESAPADLLSALMLARDEQGIPLSPEELRDQLLTLYVAGHETTSHALTWTFYLLSQHPRVLERLRAEYEAVLPDRLPTFDDLSRLTYTEQVLKEALRLYPPAYVIPRHAHSETSVAGYRIPKGSEVLVWSYFTHRDARFYPEPEQFRPERFRPEEEQTRPKYAYLPFGAGQRACIGQQFAMLEAQLILAAWLPQLHFELASRRPPRLRTGVTLSPRGGLPMRVRAR
ncbi:MAG: cytochrome P450 [Polyangiales bacterium]